MPPGCPPFSPCGNDAQALPERVRRTSSTTRPGSPTRPWPRCRAITCPVSVYFSTADVLVPINQVGAAGSSRSTVHNSPWLHDGPGQVDDKPGGPSASHGRASGRGFRGLQPGRTRRDVPAQFARRPGKPTTCELPVSADKLWSIAIIDEGPPVPVIDHRKFELLPTRNAFWQRVMIGQD